MIGIKFNLLENQRVGRQRNVMSGEESSGQCVGFPANTRTSRNRTERRNTAKMRMQQIWKHEELSKHDIWIKFNLLENQRVGRQRNVMSEEESSGKCKSSLPSKHEDQ